MHLTHRARAFGLDWRSDIALSGFDPLSPEAPEQGAPIDVYRIDRLADRADGKPVNRGIVYPDGIRFGWGDEVAFDMVGGTRIGYRPGPGWTGAMPASFYGTVAALTMAWRGVVPFHAGAVELDNRAILIAGPAGAGKSTLTAELVAAGARFVADDLVAVTVGLGGAGGQIFVERGRPTIRLHPETAARLETIRIAPVAGDARGKWLAWPHLRGAPAPLAIGSILLLDDAPGMHALGGRVPAIRLFPHVFRRRWIDAMPMRDQLMRDVLAIAATTTMRTYPRLASFDAMTAQCRAEEIIAIIRDVA